MTPEEHLAAALDGLGFQGDPEMARTPALLAAFLAEMLPQPLPPIEPLITASTDLIVVRELPFTSLCAHHLLPFFGTATLAYRPAGRVAGLGALARILEILSRRPQLQERLAAGIADNLWQSLRASSAGVKISARQMCMEMRGTRAHGTVEVIALRGRPDPALEATLR